MFSTKLSSQSHSVTHSAACNLHYLLSAFRIKAVLPTCLSQPPQPFPNFQVLFFPMPQGLDTHGFLNLECSSPSYLPGIPSSNLRLSYPQQHLLQIFHKTHIPGKLFHTTLLFLQSTFHIHMIIKIWLSISTWLSAEDRDPSFSPGRWHALNMRLQNK